MKRIFVAASILFFSGISFGHTFEEIKSAVDTARVDWVAKDTGAVENLGIYERENPFGWDKEAKVDESSIPQFDGPAVRLPTKFDWRNKDGVNWMSPIKNQAKCGSCVAFATIGMIEGRLNVVTNNPNYNPDLSEQYFFGKIGQCDRGSTPFMALFQAIQGIPDESCFPYVSGRVGEDQDVSKACSNVKDRLYMSKNYANLNSQKIKEAVTSGPVLTTMTVYEDFVYYKEGVYQHVIGDQLGGHAITIVGFNDEDKYWVVRNSWGTDWGEQGYFRIKYDDVSGVGNSGYTLDVVVPNQKVKLVKPEYREAISGIKKVQYQNLKAPAYYTLACPNVPSYIGTGTELDSTQFPDSVCELSANTAGGKPWYSLVTIVNHEPNVSIEFTPEFDATKPIKDRVYFTIKTMSLLPLTKAVVHFEKIDGSYSKTVIADDPGDNTSVGWRSKSSPNGNYNIYVEGLLGNYKFNSSMLTVTVEN